MIKADVVAVLKSYMIILKYGFLYLSYNIITFHYIFIIM